MKWITTILLSIYSYYSFCQKASIKYDQSILGDTTHFGGSTANILIPIRICNDDNNTLKYILEDVAYVKTVCYKEMPFLDFNEKIVAHLFDSNYCFSTACDSNKTVVVDKALYNSINKKDINTIIKTYFNNGRSLTNYENSTPTVDFYISIIILFHNHYYTSWGDDEYFYIKKAPIIKTMKN